jgi:hypothetical protein
METPWRVAVPVPCLTRLEIMAHIMRECFCLSKILLDAESWMLVVDYKRMSTIRVETDIYTAPCSIYW